ncbi:hypothetical protein NPIL_373961 [Nephila pilipes]|uniref:Uncharacterized protein n=1 Tax=Nephila pilipes TaxID=299642 RepID=A0A8X6NZZ3_NEPPI|nr:hypothetical protein NPIL_373961 [Nephila pilipes]
MRLDSSGALFGERESRRTPFHYLPLRLVPPALISCNYDCPYQFPIPTISIVATIDEFATAFVVPARLYIRWGLTQTWFVNPRLPFPPEKV